MRNRPPLVLIAMLTVVAVGSAQYEDWNINGAGARAEGLGGAFIGLADDATAISWNPSGLGQLERSEFSAVGRWLGQDLEVTGWSTSQSQFTYNFVSVAIPLHAGNMNIVPAVAFQKQLDEYARWEFDRSSYESDGAANTITPGIGIKLHPMFYVGGAVNIWLGKLNNNFEFAIGGHTNSQKHDGSFNGLNFTAGLLVDFEGMDKPVPIKFGATIKTPFDLKFEGDYLATRAGVPDPKEKFSSTIQMPLMFGFGASGRLWENLTISADYEMRMYGDKKYIQSYEAEGFEPLADTSDMSDSKSDLKQVRVGAEYLIVTSVGVIPIRAGFRTVPTLLADYKDGKYTDPVSGTGFTVGTGFICKAFAFDVAYSRSAYEATTQYVGTTAVTETEKYTSQIVSASVIVYF